MRERDREQLQQLRRQMEGGTQQPRAAPADPVDQLLSELEHDAELNRTQLNNTFLNKVGAVFERDGVGATEVYLLGRAQRGDADYDSGAQILLERVLPRLKNCPPVLRRRALGRYIIKILPALKERRGPHDQ